jgi:hypothetical protein
MVLVDFGGATLVRQPAPADLRLPPSSWKAVPYQFPSQAFCFNSMAWDPHVYRVKSWKEDQLWRVSCTLEDVYGKCDMFGVARMLYDMLLPASESRPFPSCSPSKLCYDDAEVRSRAVCGDAVPPL